MVLYRLVAGHVPITTDSNIKPYVPSNRLAGEEAGIRQIVWMP